MLQFIIGRAKSGKSAEIIKKIKEDVKENKESIIIVPEQYSFETEKNLLEVLGEYNAHKVAVLSFSRLCDEYRRVNGGEAGRVLGDCDKVILTKRALADVSSELEAFGKNKYYAGFVRSMADTVSELKLNAVTPQEILTCAENVKSESFSAKLRDTAKIFEQYNVLLSEEFIDPSDRLTRLYNELEGKNYFKGKNIYIDEFKGFTGQQFKLIERILGSADNLTVALCCDNSLDQPFGLFANVISAKNRILKSALKYNREIKEDKVLLKSYYENLSLLNLESVIRGCEPENRQNEGIEIIKAADVFDEAEFAALNIKRLAKEENIRYSEVAVIARNSETYLRPLKAAFKRSDIPLFSDDRIFLDSLPVFSLTLSALNLKRSLTSENILKFYKSGLDFLTPDELFDLENYVYLWNIPGTLWEKEWDMNVSGLEDKVEKDNAEKLYRLNFLREKAISPILKFKSQICDNAKEIIIALISLFDEVEAQKSFSELSKRLENDNSSLSDALKSSWDSFIAVLESLSACYKEVRLPVSEFTEAFKTACALTSVGTIPQTVDEVVFGSADKLRVTRPEYVFILGANLGVFPAVISRNGIFSNTEREELIAQGIDIPDKLFKSAIDEDFLVYSNVCRASKGVFISFRTENPDKSLAKPSAFVETLIDALDIKLKKFPDKLSPDSLPMSREAAFFEFGARKNADKQGAAAIAEALKGNDEYKAKLELIEKENDPLLYSISEESALKLFGKDIYMSASKLETFNRCRFMFFCKYGLDIHRVQPAAFDNMQRGTFVHFCLQRLIETYKKDISKLDKEEISVAVEKCAKEYLDSIPGYRSIENNYLKFIVETLKRSVKYVAEFIAADFAQSEFEPVKCELKIGGDDGDIKAIEIPVDGDMKINITGFIDRVDTYKTYVRIIDYKTGQKIFRLPDVLAGQNLQMLIYLYAVISSGKYPQIPAGILYLPASRKKKRTDRKMNGLLSLDEEVLYALEKDQKGQFVPSAKRAKDSYIEPEDFDDIFEYTKRKIISAGLLIKAGDIAADPTDDTEKNADACKYCDFSSVCRKKNEPHKKIDNLSTKDCIEEMRKENSENGN